MMGFEKCCSNVGIKPTKRQFRKFMNRRGLAYRISMVLKSNLSDEALSVDRRIIADKLSNKLGFIA